MKRRFHTLTVIAAVACSAVVVSHSGVVDAFTPPSQQIIARPLSASLSQQSARCSQTFLKAASNDDNNQQQQQELSNPIEEFARPIITATTSLALAATLLFSNPILPTLDAQARPSASAQSRTATSIEIDLKSVPALTRKAFINRDKLTNYFIESVKSFKPILDLLSESDTVTVTPPKDIKGAINEALTKGEAELNVNGESVDIRLESVPGVVVVRIINPNIPRLPFLKDGSASLRFVDDIVDVAPAELEKVAEEVQSVEKFLMWGAPQKAPLSYKGSSLSYWLSSNTLSNNGDLNNFQVVGLGIGGGIIVAYGASYSYYVSLQEEAKKKEVEKKAKMAEKKKAKAKAAAKKEEEEEEEAPPAAAEKKEEVKKPAPKSVPKPAVEKSDTSKTVKETKKEDTTATTTTEKKGRKRDAIKNIFKREK